MNKVIRDYLEELEIIEMPVTASKADWEELEKNPPVDCTLSDIENLAELIIRKTLDIAEETYINSTSAYPHINKDVVFAYFGMSKFQNR
jgi:hypothetical protein